MQVNSLAPRAVAWATAPASSGPALPYMHKHVPRYARAHELHLTIEHTGGRRAVQPVAGPSESSVHRPSASGPAQRAASRLAATRGAGGAAADRAIARARMRTQARLTRQSEGA